MNREDVIRVMRESGMTFHLGMPFELVVDQMQRVADLIVFEASVKAAKMLAQGLEEARAAEREACAKVCETFTGSYERGKEMEACANAIRARSKQ